MSTARRLLVLFAHPAFQKSRVHARLAEQARQVAGVTFRDLYEEYPDFQIDVAAEQALLREHDVIVFQHPFYWYSSPALLKEWLDLVLEYNFAYGPRGTALRGKTWVSALSAGGSEAAYARTGQNYFTIAELLAPQQQTATLCGMPWHEPFVVHGAVSATPEFIARRAGDYGALLRRLVAGETRLLARGGAAAAAGS